MPKKEQKRLVIGCYEPPSKNAEKVVIVILEQTHRGTKFATGSRTFKASNGLYLTSAACPDAGGRTFYVRGDRREDDSRQFLVPLAYIEQLRVAVREYNKAHNGNVRSEDPDVIC